MHFMILSLLNRYVIPCSRMSLPLETIKVKFLPCSGRKCHLKGLVCWSVSAEGFAVVSWSPARSLLGMPLSVGLTSPCRCVCRVLICGSHREIPAEDLKKGSKDTLK